MFKNRFKKTPKMRDEEHSRKSGRFEPTKGYEGKEHVKYKEPGYSKHEIDFPEDEPHMKSRVSKEESHEMEDNFHMKTPHHKEKLARKILRAHMNMEEPLDSEYERMGPHEMQEDESDEHEEREEKAPKEHRKKVIVAVLQRKMKKNKM